MYKYDAGFCTNMAQGEIHSVQKWRRERVTLHKYGAGRDSLCTNMAQGESHSVQIWRRERVTLHRYGAGKDSDMTRGEIHYMYKYDVGFCTNMAWGEIHSVQI